MNDIYQQSSNGNITEAGTCAHKWYHPKDVFKVAFLLTFFLGAASILLITAKTCHFVDIIEGSTHCQQLSHSLQENFILNILHGM